VAEDRFRFEKLSRAHDRRQFSCGVGSLDRYFHNIAGQDVRRHVSVVHVMYDSELARIAGFYTLSAWSITRNQIPPPHDEDVPPYEALPAFLLGRLAIDLQYRGHGLGSILLADSLRRALNVSEQIAAITMIVDAIDERAKDFYRRHGFESMIGQDRRLLTPMKFIERRTEGRAP
jgi:GNAT superfamily N-acetyltransferase